jgi:hypothetical protein
MEPDATQRVKQMNPLLEVLVKQYTQKGMEHVENVTGLIIMRFAEEKKEDVGISTVGISVTLLGRISGAVAIAALHKALEAAYKELTSSKSLGKDRQIKPRDSLTHS